MPIITLTSDLGSTSHYAAVLKGMILSLYPAATIVDVTHHIPSFDLMEAAFVTRNTYTAFPPGTIHVIAVDPEFGETATGLIMRYRDHFFVAPNNGVLSLVNNGEDHECVEIRNEGLVKEGYPKSFRTGGVLGPAAAFLASGGPLEEVGPYILMKELRWGEPTYAGNALRGKIIHIDKFGNAITNIQKEEFLKIRDGRSFEVFIRSVRLKRIVNTYSDVGKADALAIFGQSAMLEIAMREASAAELLGLKVHDMITIEFK
jgi:S-adenosylmethionine hydrolase